MSALRRAFIGHVSNATGIDISTFTYPEQDMVADAMNTALYLWSKYPEQCAQFEDVKACIKHHIEMTIDHIEMLR